MKQLVIIGAGGFGREVFTLAKDTPAHGVDWKIKGFLDSRKDVLDHFAIDANSLPGAVYATQAFRERCKRNVGIIGDPMSYEPEPEDAFICALGDPIERQDFVDKGVIHSRRCIDVDLEMRLLPGAELDDTLCLHMWSVVETIRNHMFPKPGLDPEDRFRRLQSGLHIR